MPTGEIVAASAALIGAFGSQILSYYFGRRKEKSERKREFYHNVIDHTGRIISAYETYLDDYSVGDDIPYQTASRAKNRMIPQSVRKENFNNPEVASDSLIKELQELQAVSWEIDDLEMPGRNEMDPYTDDIAKNYLNTMLKFKNKAEEINEAAVSELN